MKAPETAVDPEPPSGLVEMNTGDPAQFVSPGAYTTNVTLPVGATAPPGGDSVAVSWKELPRVTELGETTELIVTAGSGLTVAWFVPKPEPDWPSVATAVAEAT
jgi:hypothetical protein